MGMPPVNSCIGRVIEIREQREKRELNERIFSYIQVSDCALHFVIFIHEYALYEFNKLKLTLNSRLTESKSSAAPRNLIPPLILY